MKARTIFAAVILLGAVAIASAVPDQPFMFSARNDLNRAQAELRRATTDKAGHRANAIGLTTRAIAEVNAGIAYDRRHNHPVSLTAETLFGAPDQPHMQNALTSLESARDNLNKASADKGGHRAAALGYVNDAISEVRKGIEAGRN